MVSRTEQVLTVFLGEQSRKVTAAASTGTERCMSVLCCVLSSFALQRIVACSDRERGGGCPAVFQLLSLRFVYTTGSCIISVLHTVCPATASAAAGADHVRFCQHSGVDKAGWGGGC